MRLLTTYDKPIKRNTTLEEVLEHWNHNEKSSIGLGRISRKLNADGIYVHSKEYGRKDLLLINVDKKYSINGIDVSGVDSHDQYSIEPMANRNFYKVYLDNSTDLNKALYVYVKEWFDKYREEIKIQLHYAEWIDNVEIKNVVLADLIVLLNSYKYNDIEANILWENLRKAYTVWG